MLRNQHGGDIYRNVIEYDFSINLNPLGMPNGVKEVLRATIDTWSRYPDPECETLIQALADTHDIPATTICCGNGAAELIFQLVQVKKPRQAMVLSPTFSEYEQALRSVGCEVDYYELKEEAGFTVDIRALCNKLAEERINMLFLCNPNNPTGIPLRKNQVEELARMCQANHIFLVVDECFVDFLEEPKQYSILNRIEKYPELMVIKAFTKTYAMAGLRLGYAICADGELLKQMKRTGQPWNVSLPAQLAGVAALKETDYLHQTKELITGQRKLLKEALAQLNYIVYDSQANYIFFREKSPGSAANLWERLKDRRILIRDCSNYRGLGTGYYRIGIKTERENQMLLEALMQMK